MPQKLTLEEDTGTWPLALVVVMEVGGVGAREFDNEKLVPIAPMLETVIGNWGNVSIGHKPTCIRGPVVVVSFGMYLCRLES